MDRRVVALAAIVGFGAACTADLPALPPDPRSIDAPPPAPPSPFTPRPLIALSEARRAQLAALNAGRRRWLTHAPARYRLTVARQCFCAAGSPSISIVQGTAVAFASGGTADSGRDIEPELRTVEALFNEAAHQLRSGADDVDVRFDAELGYPLRIAVDMKWDWFDDEMTWTATVEVLDAAGAR